MKKCLVLCTGNSCRSQMAEAIWQTLGNGQWEVESAGSKPAGYVHPKAIAAMAEDDIDISEATSKNLNEFLEDKFDVVVTVCDNAQEACPVFPGANMLHWPFPDPAYATGSEDEIQQAFRQVRDDIKQRIAAYLTD